MHLCIKRTTNQSKLFPELPFEKDLLNQTRPHYCVYCFENSHAAQVAAELLGDPEGVWVFKERINYKLPGGGGFAPHQDAPAW